MRLATVEPFTLFHDLDRLFTTPVGTSAVRGWMPRVDVFDREDRLVVRAELPGVSPDDVDITIEQGALIITGERRFETSEQDGDFHRREIFQGEFRRSILLPEGIDLDNVTASTKDGVLEIVVPRSPEVLPKKVKVELA